MTCACSACRIDRDIAATTRTLEDAVLEECARCGTVGPVSEACRGCQVPAGSGRPVLRVLDEETPSG